MKALSLPEPDEDGGAAAQGEQSGPARTETSEARKLVRSCSAVRGAVALLDERTRELQIRAGIGLTREASSTTIRTGSTAGYSSFSRSWPR